jgi:8-oxo-dGTP pyrophosphatase MutT (NUDIX family)
MNVRQYSSSGGVVVQEGRVLLVRKKALPEIRLPKGHIEPGEGRADAALREVAEETGYAHLRLLADLGRLDVEFEFDGEWVQRNESFFLMELTDLALQPREEKEEAKFEVFWAGLEAAEDLLTFASEREFLRRGRAWLQTRRTL